MTEAYPLKWPEGWPRARWRSSGSFSRNLDYDRALRDLETELERLKAVVISCNMKPGRVAAVTGADPRRDSGVAIYFTFNAKQMAMAQDSYDTVAKNMRSLTIAIDAMRAIGRHGGGYMMQRSFDGFAQLPPPGGDTGYQKKPWRDVLKMTGISGLIVNADQLVLAENRYKSLARGAHPDNGGSADAMAELNIAIEDARAELG